jgi:hypothetical protein
MSTTDSNSSTAREAASLDSPEVSRGRFRRTLAATGVAAVCLFLAGCQEDRSNLLPRDSTERIESQITRIQTQVVDGLCFEALEAAQEIEDEIEGIGPTLDPALLRTLRDGITQLQIMIQDECVESGATDIEPVIEEADPIEEMTPPSGGTTTPPETGGGGQQRPEPTPAPEPAPTPEPTPPDNSGGVSPSSSGGMNGA